MQKLVLLYWGCIFLMYLSEAYYPAYMLSDRSSRRSFMWHRADVFMVMVIVWMTCFSFLRTSYNDTENYIHGFESAKTAAQLFADGLFSDLGENPMSILYTSLMRGITENYHIYFMIPALLNSLAVVKLLKRYSASPALSLLIFFSVGTYSMYIAAMKQCFAFFFLLLALPYMLDKKYIRFYALVLLAMLFHSHAVVFALLPLMTGKPWGKMTWVVVAAMVVVVLNYDRTMTFFVDAAQTVGLNVRADEVFDGHQINVLRVVVYWIPPLIALLFRGRLFSNIEKEETLFVNMSTISAVVLSLGLVQGANLYGRMAGYFEIGTAVVLPWMVRKLFTRQSAQLVTIFAGALYFGYFAFEFGVSKNFGADYAAISLWEFVRELLG